MPEFGTMASICPLVQCPKRLLNGSCGGTNAHGKYELNPIRDFVWVMIYRKLDEIAGTHDWSKQIRPGTLEVEIIGFVEKLNCDLYGFANCGQCQDTYSMDLPFARLIFIRELAEVFKNEPGMDVNTPIPLKSVTNDELAVAGVELQFQVKWVKKRLKQIKEPLR